LENRALKRQRKKSDRMASKGFPNPIDVHVGNRIRMFRELQGASQSKLGEALNLTFQQIQKYETGSNRVSSSRLFDMAKFFGKQIADFFADMPDDVQRQSPAQLAGELPTEVAAVDGEEGFPIGREGLFLARAYIAIGDQDTRKNFRALVQSVAAGYGEGNGAKKPKPGKGAGSKRVKPK
jgi:transcriptional regulator with XRE-family HTH domain